jgi:hypothetical protein
VRLGTRVHVAAVTTRRELTYFWTAPRSPVGKVVVLPLLLSALLLVFVLGLLALAVLFVTMTVAVIGVAGKSLLHSIGKQLDVSSRKGRR